MYPLNLKLATLYFPLQQCSVTHFCSSFHASTQYVENKKKGREGILCVLSPHPVLSDFLWKRALFDTWESGGKYYSLISTGDSWTWEKVKEMLTELNRIIFGNDNCLRGSCCSSPGTIVLTNRFFWSHVQKKRRVWDGVLWCGTKSRSSHKL